MLNEERGLRILDAKKKINERSKLELFVCLFDELQHCITKSENEMICTTPLFKEQEVPKKERRRKRDGRQKRRQLIVGALNDPGLLDFFAIFEMDGVETYLGRGDDTVRYMFMYYNPHVFAFTDNKKIFRTYKDEKILKIEVSDALPVSFQILVEQYKETFINDCAPCFLSSYLKGKNLTYGCDIKDYTIRVGAEPCPVIMLASNRIECEPPQDRPELGSHPVDGNPRVTVRCVHLNI